MTLCGTRPSQICLAPGLDRTAKSSSHHDRITGRGNGGINEACICPHLHGLAGFGWFADARIHNDGNGNFINEYPKHLPGLQPAIGRSEERRVGEEC